MLQQNDTLESADILAKLRAGDESAFMMLVDQHQASLVRIAMIYVRDRATAEEVVQDTWIAVLRGLDKFEGRASLKTWIFKILVNRAKTRAQREGRYQELGEISYDEPTVDPERFHPAEHPDAFHWSTKPESWHHSPEDMLLSREIGQVILMAIEKLPTNQQEVITLRDVEGATAEEVCSLLGISDVYQRVLLHRARAMVRQAIEKYMNEYKKAV